MVTRLSDRMRPNSDAAPWVVDAVKQMIDEMKQMGAELTQLRGALTIARGYVMERLQRANHQHRLSPQPGTVDYDLMVIDAALNSPNTDAAPWVVDEIKHLEVEHVQLTRQLAQVRKWLHDYHTYLLADRDLTTASRVRAFLDRIHEQNHNNNTHRTGTADESE